MDTTAARLRKGFKAKGLTAVAVAESIGVTHQLIGRILTDKTPGKKHMPTFAKMLNCSVEWLLNGTGSPPTWASTTEEDHPASTDLLHQLQAMEKRINDRIDALSALLQSRPCTAGTSAHSSGQPDAEFHLVPPSKTRVPAAT